MKKIIVFLTLFFTTTISFAQLAGKAGTFTRMGFNARTIGMGNAFTAVIDNGISFYNPAVTPFLTQRNVSASFGILSLDRSLNTLSYSQPLAPAAGLSASIFNAGVRNIDGRDNAGNHTSMYSTSENQFAFTFGNRFSKKLALGVGLKIYYYSLFEKVSSTGFGIDIGAIYNATEDITIGATVRDILTKYRWDTSELYGKNGNSTKEQFPLLRTFGISYRLPENFGIVSAEIENSNQQTNNIRVGTEIHIIEQLSLRAGVENVNAEEIAPTFGFTVRTNFETFSPSLHYAFRLEPYGFFGMHVISLSTAF